jgi:ribonucleoside-diphosphate reductase alpha chain
MNVPLRQGPTTPASIATFRDKYCQPGEGFREVCNRVAFALSDSPEHYHKFRSILLDMRFIPAGRILSNMGTTKATTPYNCFVSGTIQDSFVDGEGNIMHRAYEAAATMRMGGGIGYDFSTMRPAGDLITKLQSYSTGPVSFMRIFNEIGICTSSSGHRRGAQMGVMRVDHPDIEQFVLAKQNETELRGFNLSVAVTDEFMHAVEANKPFNLKFNGRVYRTVRARDLWERIMRSTWDWAEPGVIFIDAINRMNNLRYCETISATNPCAEQPLPPHGACLLGSFNLAAYTFKGDNGYYVNLERMALDIPVVLRAMDNVIDRAMYPMKMHMQEAMSKRRMGMGVTGMANAIEACGHPYGTSEFIEGMRVILRTLRDHAYSSSVQLAAERGSFPVFNKDAYLSGAFVKTLPSHIQEGIGTIGIRNSHLISIAPTGTISFCADNISSGLEPVFSVKEVRSVRGTNGYGQFEVEDYGHKFFGVEPRRTCEVSAKEHIAVLTAAQEFVDSSISKTCNVGDAVTWEEFREIYVEAWKGGAKGCTTYRAAGERGGIRRSCDGDTCGK